MNKIDEIKKQLVWKVKDAKNTNTIFDKRKYLLYDDVIKILNEALIIDSVIVPKGTLGCDCPFTDHCIYQKDKCESPIEYGCGYKQPNAL